MNNTKKNNLVNTLYTRYKTKKNNRYKNEFPPLVSKMPIAIITIKDFLKFYKLDIRFEDIFYQENIRYSFDILDFFYSKSFLEFIVKNLLKLYKFTRNDIKTDREKEQIFTTQLNKFMLAYKDLESQKKEYKIYFSIFKRKPSRKQFNDLLESEDFINSFSTKLDSLEKTPQEFIDLLNFLGFDFFLHDSADYLFHFLIFLDLDYIKTIFYFFINKKNFFNNFTSISNEAEYQEFIITNKQLIFLIDSKNKFSMDNIIKNLIEFGYKNMLEVYKEFDYDVIFEVYDPIEEIESKRLIGRKIYNHIRKYIFPDKEQIFINKFIDSIKTIPSRFPKNPKIRIFTVNAHGYIYSPSDYKKIPRLDYNKFSKSFKKKNTIIFTQSYGKLSYQSIFDTLIKIYRTDYRNINYGEELTYGVLNAKTRTHMQKVNNFIRLMHYKFWNYKYVTKKQFEYTFLDFLEDPEGFKKHYKDNQIVDLLKYNHNHPPPDVYLSFRSPSENERLKGIFEIDPSTINDLNKLANQVIGPSTNISKFGLSPHPTIKYNEQLLMYNEQLSKLHYRFISLSDIIQLINNLGNIKKDEHILVYVNICRGAVDDFGNNFNTMNKLIPDEKNIAKILRQLSYDRSFGSEPM